MTSNKKGSFSACVLRNEPLSPSCHILLIERPAGFPEALPGQFISIRVSEMKDPLLRRPYSIMDLTEGALTLMVKAVGSGSSILVAKAPGEQVDFIGPLGGSPFPEPGGRGIVFVAGGTGLAPIIFAARSWKRQGFAEGLYLMYGAASKEELMENLVEGEFSECHLATLDGSAGYRGDVAAMCEELVEKGALPTEVMYSCGPRGMVRSLIERVDKQFDIHFTSLESIMACGVGACRGCSVPVRESGSVVFKAICSDGTVFNARDIAWEEWKE